MLQIIKKDGVDGYESIIRDLGADPDNVSVSEAVDGENVNGYGIYNIAPDAMTVYKISYGDDLMLADGILRSVLFLAALKGVEKALLLNGSEALAKKLGMIKEGNILEPISDIFGGCESCKK